MDPRHQERITVLENLFASTFHNATDSMPHPDNEMTKHVLENTEKIDNLIHTHAPKFPLDKMSKTDLSILRLAIYELIVEPKEPAKVVINEAVELAKEFGGDRSYAFVNAVLGMIVKDKE